MPGQGAQQQKGSPIPDYITVAERIAEFYDRHPEGRIITEIIDQNIETGFVLMKAFVFRNPTDDVPAATGHAYEIKNEGYVNRTSHIENCETGAIGRALANAGFEVKRGNGARPAGHSQRRADAGERAPEADYSENNWRAGEGWRSRIVDLESSKKNPKAMRDWHETKFGHRAPWLLDAGQIKMYEAYLKSQK